MDYFAWLQKSVAEAVARKRIGEPVSLRAFFHLSADHGRLMGTLGEALEAASAWFPAAPSRVYALGGVSAGEVTAMIEYGGGQTALVSVAVLRDPASLVDLLLIGNRGTLRYRDHPAAPEPGRVHQKLLAAVESSLRAQGPVEVGR